MLFFPMDTIQNVEGIIFALNSVPHIIIYNNVKLGIQISNNKEIYRWSMKKCTTWNIIQPFKIVIMQHGRNGWIPRNVQSSKVGSG